mgnify:CR=1 FL=1
MLGTYSGKGTVIKMPPPPSSIIIQFNSLGSLSPKLKASSEHSKEKYLEPVKSILQKCTIIESHGLGEHVQEFRIFFFELKDGTVEKIQIDTTMSRDSGFKACFEGHLKREFKLKDVIG